MKHITLIFALALAACASTEPTPFKGPNNKQAYSLKCSGMGKDWEDCYAEAGSLCPNGYTIISQSSSPIASAPAGSNFVMVSKQHMAIECK